MPHAPLRVVLAEDSVLVREGIVEVLARFGHRVLAAVPDGKQLVAAVAEHRPDIVITDVRMPPDYADDGLRAAVELRGRYPGLAILVLSQYIATAYATELFIGDRWQGAGLGYLLKDRVGAVADFVESVERVSDGGIVIDPDVVRQLLKHERRDRPLSQLTPREREVLGLLAEGGSNAMVARSLVISEAAVAKHIGNIFAKLGLSPEDGHRRVLAVLAYLHA